MRATLNRRLVSEAVGTAILLAAVVGSGIMAERLSGGNQALALLANTVATGAALVALILTFGPISGAHFNPAVTMADASQGGLAWSEVPGYIGAQLLGAAWGCGRRTSCFRNDSSWSRCTRATGPRSCSASSSPRSVFSR